MSQGRSFVIDRDTWLRGEGQGNSFLLRESDEKLCCLGFYGLACGLSEEDICSKRMYTPGFRGYFGEPLPPEMGWLVEQELPSVPARRLSDMNDLRRLPRSDSRREESIIELFAAQGITVTFIN